MTSVPPTAPSPPASDSAGESAISAATESVGTPAGATTTDRGPAATSSTAAVPTSTPPAPPPLDTASVAPSPTALSDPAPGTLASSALQSSSSLSVSSSSLLQTPSGSATSTSIIPDDAQITNTSSPAPTSGDGLSTGAVVGIAVGCLVAGVIIGLLVSLFLLHRRRKPAPAQVIEIRAGDKRPDSRALTATPVEPIAPVSDLDHFLPVPTSDKELATEMQSLGYLIQQHVEDNYHLSPVRPASGPLGQVLVDLGLGEGDGSLPRPEQLAAMALDPNTRFAALQHVIARVIFGSLSVESAGKVSMLPPSVSILVREMPPCEKHMGNPEAISAALTRWRQITAFLLNPSRSERGVIVPEEESLEPRARQLVAEMNTFLGAFIDGKNRQHQQDHLLDVVLECAKFGYSIFSQPADFIWQFGTGGGMDIVVCPGLEKVSDSHGIRCQPEMTITPEVHRV